MGGLCDMDIKKFIVQIIGVQDMVFLDVEVSLCRLCRCDLCWQDLFFILLDNS